MNKSPNYYTCFVCKKVMDNNNHKNKNSRLLFYYFKLLIYFTPSNECCFQPQPINGNGNSNINRCRPYSHVPSLSSACIHHILDFVGYGC